VFVCRQARADKFFPKAVERAQVALKGAGKDAIGLDGYTWHCNRHTFASRPVMAGVDLRTVQDLGGWRTVRMVQRYAHLVSDHLQAAVERLVSGGRVQNFGVTSDVPCERCSRCIVSP
jgi:integrase